jgi:hypothetical protein
VQFNAQTVYEMASSASENEPVEVNLTRISETEFELTVTTGSGGTTTSAIPTSGNAGVLAILPDKQKIGSSKIMIHLTLQNGGSVEVEATYDPVNETVTFEIPHF